MIEPPLASSRVEMPRFFLFFSPRFLSLSFFLKRGRSGLDKPLATVVGLHVAPFALFPLPGFFLFPFWIRERRGQFPALRSRYKEFDIVFFSLSS